MPSLELLAISQMIGCSKQLNGGDVESLFHQDFYVSLPSVCQKVAEMIYRVKLELEIGSRRIDAGKPSEDSRQEAQRWLDFLDELFIEHDEGEMKDQHEVTSSEQVEKSKRKRGSHCHKKGKGVHKTSFVQMQEDKRALDQILRPHSPSCQEEELVEKEEGEEQRESLPPLPADSNGEEAPAALAEPSEELSPVGEDSEEKKAPSPSQTFLQEEGSLAKGQKMAGTGRRARRRAAREGNVEGKSTPPPVPGVREQLNLLQKKDIGFSLRKRGDHLQIVVQKEGCRGIPFFSEGRGKYEEECWEWLCEILQKIGSNFAHTKEDKGETVA